ncbi:exosortase C-terminal domain/associated protein EpsI [Roseiconus lacunae]|uniref:EpsI family protein n=1 Tax=Roseiconus lacunae TaxID=2605694 RepID=A0ABT7PEB5_9BACT|nr:exosortase C-terminal domain/associated protein EpsI [Roseiconus lacunae]MCD0459867.1 EpsI family protein [Roseiconus lacunae]MDM4014566.1 EpsI family protein [Roseiconus lacunae]WRQ49879.1 EpsI family protein [Stieleria sp. HD01]
MNRRIVSKSVFVLVLLVASNFAVAYIREGYEMGSVVPPKKDLAEMPLTLGSWSGTNLPADPRLREILCAKSGVDRVYRNEEATDVLVHAVWTDDYLRLHFPQQCYRESGWELIDTNDIQIERSPEKSFPAKILTFKQDGRQIQVLYWFQLGEHVFLDRVQHRLLRRKVCWGKTEWPPLMKFMLETEDTGLERSESSLIEVASLLDQQIQNSESDQ